MELVLSLSSICHIFIAIHELIEYIAIIIPSYNNTTNPRFFEKKNNNIILERIRAYYTPLVIENGFKKRLESHLMITIMQTRV